MRIGLVSGPWIPVPPATYGGTERVVDTLARGFAAAGHEVLLAAPIESTCPVRLVPGMRPAVYEGLGTSLSASSAMLSGPIRGCRMWTSSTTTPWRGPSTCTGPAGVPVVTTIHGPIHAQAADIYRAIARRGAVIAISRDQSSHAPDVPVTRVIHHGMDLSAVPVGTGSGGYLCFVGRFVSGQGTARGHHHRPAGGDAPENRREDARAGGSRAIFREVVEPMLGPNEDFVGEVDDADQVPANGWGHGVPEPHPVVRAVRPGDDRGAGHRHSGDRHAHRRGPGNRGARPDGIPGRRPTNWPAS